MVIHVVSLEDTLSGIANYYNVSIDKILEYNSLFNQDKLLVGQTLIIPTEGTIYTIKYGDVLWKIAEKYGVSTSDLIKMNKIINPNVLFPGTKLTIPKRSKPIIDVNAYTYNFGDSAVSIVEELGNDLTYLSPFAYLIKEDGGLESIDDGDVIRTAIKENIVPIMTIANFSMKSKGENIAHIVLNSPEITQILLNNIVKTMKEKGYKGLNIDFENVLPDDRDAYAMFLQNTVDRMHEEGFFFLLR
jgi:spore germination protein